MKKRYRNLGAGALVAVLTAAGAPDVQAFGPVPPGMSEYVTPTPGGMMERARKMMRSGNYAGAIDCLRSLMLSGADLGPSEREECEYMLARSLYERGDAACLDALAGFCASFPASTRTPEAKLLQGDYYYFHEEFGPAAGIYLDCDIAGLDARTRALYTFRKGVSLTKAGFYTEARSAFRELRSNPDYSLRARFYLAYILYVKGEYDSAYEEFAAIEGEGGERVPSSGLRRSRRGSDYETTGFEAGYYMAQIDYLREEWNRVITRGNDLLERQPVAELKPELWRIMGESLFKTGRTDEARSYIADYLESCRADGSEPRPTAVYTMGAILYAQGDYDEAEALFSRIADNDDELGQSANLYLGQCYMREGDSSAAAMAFDRAYKSDYDSKVSETALYNYIAARTNGGSVPFSSAIPMLEEFLNRFPRSEFAPAVEEYLATAYYHEKDYAKAMASIERIPNPGAKVLAARQKVAYELGVECLVNDNAAAAAKYMTIAGEKRGGDAAIARESKLWLGDALYADGKYAKATAAYESYLREARRDANRTLALYDLGYSLYMEGKYARGASRFDEALKASPALPASLRTDATIRMADCLYYTGDTRAAIDSYSRAIEAGATDADYALLRRAMTHGSAGDQKSKIADLRALLRSYPESKWAPQALLEEGIAYTDMGDDSHAAAAFEQLSRQYAATPEARKGWLNLAILRQNAGESERAIEAYKQLISRWPSSEEAAMASDDLRKIYASRGDLRELAAWLAQVPGAPQLDTDEIERLAFDAAGRALNDNPDDTARLEKYVADYPEGRYLAQALYDLTDTYYTNGDYAKALASADRLLQARPDSRQAAAALGMKAEILERHSGDGHKAEAFEAWRELERRGGAEWALDAYAGMMRTASDPNTILDYARRLRGSGGLGSEQAEEADLHEALALLRLKRQDEARAILRRLSANPASEAGARAAYELGQNLLDAGRTAEARKALTDFTDAGSPHSYWLARGFIALADTYHAQGKTYLGREYLTSLRQNYPGDEADIREMIDTRLNKWKSK